MVALSMRWFLLELRVNPFVMKKKIGIKVLKINHPNPSSLIHFIDSEKWVIAITKFWRKKPIILFDIQTSPASLKPFRLKIFDKQWQLSLIKKIDQAARVWSPWSSYSKLSLIMISSIALVMHIKLPDGKSIHKMSFRT